MDVANSYMNAANTAYNQAAEYERRMMDKALELAKGYPPEFNITPLVELVKRADAMGLDLVRRS